MWAVVHLRPGPARRVTAGRGHGPGSTAAFLMQRPIEASELQAAASGLRTRMVRLSNAARFRYSSAAPQTASTDRTVTRVSRTGQRAMSGSVLPGEVDKFDRLARDWWDPAGPMRPLHRINPVRLAFIREEACGHFGRDVRTPFPLEGLDVLDVGCGAGLLSEPLARLGGSVSGLDPAPGMIEAARLHAEESGLPIAYRADAVETLAAEGARFDVVVAMEVVEHVADVPAFVGSCGEVLKPGGLLLLATINRTLRSFALAIVGAEYVLRWLPKGTHDWDRFVTPGELGHAVEKAGLADYRTRGMVFHPLDDAWRLSRDTAVNYLASAAKPSAS